MALQCTPNSQLVFKGPFNVVSTTELELFNSGNDRLSFKIRTTAPKRYCVKPNSGFLEPQERKSIEVKLQPTVNNSLPDDRTKHKFMIQWAVVPKTYTDDIENFWKQGLSNLDVKDSKLSCSFVDDKPADTELKPQSVKNPKELKSTTELGYLCSERVVETSPGAELICSICHNILWKPIACTTCENVFCATCIRTWIKKVDSHQNDQFFTTTSEEKPEQSEHETNCGDPSSYVDSHRQETCPFHCMFKEKRAPPIVNTLLSRLQIYCAYRDNGCQQKLDYDALEAHERICEYERIPCSVCQMYVSQQDPANNQHDIRQCFARIKEMQINNQVQTQLMMLLNVIDEQNKRIKTLEDRLNNMPH